jgi:hypothetical protein
MRFKILLFSLLFCVCGDLNAQISISGLSALSANPGDAITIAGSGFGNSISSNAVFFGGVKAVVTNATTSSLTVTVPSGVTYGPVSVINLTSQTQAISTVFFTPVFTPSKGSVWTLNDFDPLVAPGAINGLFLEYFDVDGDGKVDILESQTNPGGFRIKRNVSVPGTLNTSSFSNGTLITIGQTYLESVTKADMNNDGKLDVIVAGSAGGTGSTLTGTISIYINNSTSGNISFAAPITKTYNMRVGSTCAGRAGAIKCVDLDRNGWPDVVLANSNYSYGGTNNGSCTVTLLGAVFSNTNGVLGSQQNIVVSGYSSSTSRITQLDCADLNNDGKLDLIFGVRSRTYVLKNTSIPNDLTSSSFVLVNSSLANGDRMILVGDFNLDGKIDLGVAGRSSSTTLRLYRNTSTNQGFSFATAVSITIGDRHATVNNKGGAVGDITGDGRPELLIGGVSPSILLNKITSTTATWTTTSFSALSGISMSTNLNSVSILDLDHDGKSDIVGRSGTTGNALAMRRSNPIPSVAVGSLALEYCPGTQLDVPFITTYSVNTNNTYTVQLSNATGSFTSPITIGSLTTNATTGNISCIIPSNTPAGTAYKIRVNASSPAVTGSSNSGNIIINSSVAPTVNITSSQNLICLGTQVVYSATEQNGGTAPIFTWRKNGQIVGSNSATYTNTSPANGDVVYVQMQGNAQCSVNAATSNTVTLTGVNVVTPSVTISNSQITICDFTTSVTYNAVGNNGGANPVYQWFKNGMAVGPNASQWTDTQPQQGDQVEVQMTSSASCVSSPTTMSNMLTLQYSATTVLPTVTISTSQSNLCVGVSQVVFNATFTNGGNSPTFQWRKNGVNVGTNAAQYVLNNPANNDQVQLILTSNADCANPINVSSNIITLTTQGLVTPNISISTPQTTLCGNSSGIQYSASLSNGGSNPLVSWYKNGVLMVQGTNTYNNPNPSNGDVVYATLVSNASCVTASNVSSNSISIVVNPVVNPSISMTLTQGTNPKCTGGFQQLSVVVINGGNSPTYAWYRNGVVVNGATTATYGSAAWAVDDAIYCQVTPNNSCQSTNVLLTSEFLVDENTPTDFYADADGDGFGDINVVISDCGAPIGYVDNALDCDDNAANVYPGNAEVCDWVDNDCNGEIDEFVTITFYADLDGDGYGDLTNTTESCTPPNGFVSDASDCDDLAVTYVDNDNDGFGGTTAAECGSYTNDDCDDSNFNVSPFGMETCGNGIDEDCNGFDEICIVLGCIDPLACNFNAQATQDDGSCILPQIEVCNGLDDNCNGITDEGLVGIGTQPALTINTALYPTCSTGNIASANLNNGVNTSLIAGNGPDLWYKLTASYNTLRAGLSAAIGDNSLYLLHDLGTCLQQVEVVQLANTGGNQTLFCDELIVGQNYYIVLHGEGGIYNASAKMCFNHFVASTCDHTYSNYTGIYASSCSSFKAQYKANAVAYAFNVTGASQNGAGLNITPWSYSTPSASSVVSRIGRIFPSNLTGTPIVYELNVPVVYSVPDAMGNLNTLTATGGTNCTVTMSPELTVALRTLDRCPTSKTLNSYISVDRTICAAEKYEWEFTQVLPVAQAAIRVMGGLNASTLFLNNVPGIANSRTYNVRVRPVYYNGTKGEWGTAQCLVTAASGMVVQQNSDAKPLPLKSTGFTVYPNPASQYQIHLVFDAVPVSNSEIVIWDAIGNCALRFKSNLTNATSIEIPIGELADGIYLIQCGDVTQRLVISK